MRLLRHSPWGTALDYNHNMKHKYPLYRDKSGVAGSCAFFKATIFSLIAFSNENLGAQELTIQLNEEKEEVSMRTVCELGEVALGAQADRSSFSADEDIQRLSRLVPENHVDRNAVIEILVSGTWLKEGVSVEIVELFKQLSAKYPKRDPKLLARIAVALRFYDQSPKILRGLDDFEKANDSLWSNLALFIIVFKTSPEAAVESASAIVTQTGRRISKDQALKFEFIRRLGGLSQAEMIRKIRFSDRIEPQLRRLLIEVVSDQKIKVSEDRLDSRDAIYAHWSHGTAPSRVALESKLNASFPERQRDFDGLMHLNEALTEISSDPNSDPCQGGGFKVWMVTSPLLQ